MPNQVGDLGYASELGNYAEYSGAPNEGEVLQYARVVIDVWTSPLGFSLVVIYSTLQVALHFITCDRLMLTLAYLVNA